MKVLQLGKAYPPVNYGGIEYTIQLLTEGLWKSGINCDVLGANDKFKSSTETYEFGTIYREPLITKLHSTLLSFHLIWRMKKINKKYDIIHVHHPDPMSAMALILTKPTCKIVVHWHSDIIKQKKLFFFYKPIQNLLLSRASKIIATTKNYANNSAHLKKFLDKTVVIPIGIPSPIKTDDSQIAYLKNEFCGRKIVLSIGRLSYYKGFDVLIKSMALLPSNYVLIIIGGGEQELKLKKLVTFLNIENKVQFLNYVSEASKIAYLKVSNVFVLASNYKTEAYGIVQVEALACGKPIVSTEIPGSGVQWINQNGVTGFTVPINNPEKMSEAISGILENENITNTFSKNAIYRFQSELTSDIMIEKVLKLYEQLMKPV